MPPLLHAGCRRHAWTAFWRSAWDENIVAAKHTVFCDNDPDDPLNMFFLVPIFFRCVKTDIQNESYNIKCFSQPKIFLDSLHFIYRLKILCVESVDLLEVVFGEDMETPEQFRIIGVLDGWGEDEEESNIGGIGIGPFLIPKKR